jgi:catechol 2,3-dioxygenase-like lactoylglutathione lyase family enzyme
MSAISVVNTMTSRFWRQSEQPINNQLSTINRLRVRGPFGHMSFHLPDMATLRKALDHLKKHDVDLEDPGDEIGPEAPGSPHMGLWFHDLDGYRWELSVQGGK